MVSCVRGTPVHHHHLCPLCEEDGAQCRLPHHQLLPLHNRGSPRHSVCWVSRALTLSPSSPQRGNPPSDRAGVPGGSSPSPCLKGQPPRPLLPREDAPHPQREGALPSTTAPWAGASAPAPSPPQCPRPGGASLPFPREGLRLLHSAARQVPSTATSPWRRGALPLSPRPGDCGWH